MGIFMSERSNVEIRNGTVRDFFNGITEGSSGQNHRVIDVRVISNGGNGIYLYGTSNLVKGCTVSDNGILSSTTVSGIYVGNNCTVTGNTAINNGGSATDSSYVYGIRVGNDCIVTGNTASSNGNNGTNRGYNYRVYGIEAGNGSTVTSNTASNNGALIEGSGSDSAYIYGIKTGNGSTVTGNTASYNGKQTVSYSDIYGIDVGEGSTVRGNTVYQNGNGASAVGIGGIKTSPGCTVIGNTAYKNGSGTTGIGISLGNDNFVDQNTAFNNFGTNMNTPASGLVTTNNWAP